MTYKKIVEEIRDCCLKHISVNSFRDGIYQSGSVYQINGESDIDYPVAVLVSNSHISREFVLNYSFNLFYIDRLTEGRTNKNDIQSEGMQTLREVLNRLTDSDNFDLDYTLSYTLFSERFADECAGVYVTFTVQTGEPVRDCFSDLKKCNTCNTKKNLVVVEEKKFPFANLTAGNYTLKSVVKGVEFLSDTCYLGAKRTQSYTTSATYSPIIYYSSDFESWTTYTSAGISTTTQSGIKINEEGDRLLCIRTKDTIAGVSIGLDLDNNLPTTTNKEEIVGDGRYFFGNYVFALKDMRNSNLYCLALCYGKQGGSTNTKNYAITNTQSSQDVASYGLIYAFGKILFFGKSSGEGRIYKGTELPTEDTIWDYDPFPGVVDEVYFLNDNIFVLGHDDDDSGWVKVSPDGDNWQTLSVDFQDGETPTSIAYGMGEYLITSDKGNIYYASSITDQWESFSLSTERLNDSAWYSKGGQFIVVDNDTFWIIENK